MASRVVKPRLALVQVSWGADKERKQQASVVPCCVAAGAGWVQARASRQVR